MRKLLAVCLLAGAGAAQAVPISEPHDIDSVNSVGYTHFTVTSEGYFTIDATNQNDGRLGYWWDPNIDPELYIFRNDGDLTEDDEVAHNDDGGRRYNSRVANLFLAGGSYIAAVSDWSFSLSEAVEGINGWITPGTIDVTVSAGDTWRNFFYTPEAHLDSEMSVPEPTSLALLGLGLIAAVGVRRKSLTKG